MRVFAFPSLNKSLLTGLALSVAVPASAVTVTVADGSNGTVASLREAIVAVNQVGFVEDTNTGGNVTHEIVIDSALYDVYAEDLNIEGSYCNGQQALPTLWVPTRISSTGTLEETDSVPPIASRDLLILDGIGVAAGLSARPGPFDSQSIQCSYANVFVFGGELVMTDSVLTPGPDSFFGSAVFLDASSGTIERSEIGGFGRAVYGTRNQFFGGNLTFDMVDITISGDGAEGGSSGIQLYNYDSGSLTNVDISGFEGGEGAALYGGAWVVNGGAFSNNFMGLRLGEVVLDLDGTVFDGNTNQAIYAGGGGGDISNGLHIAIRNASFSDNAGESGGAIYYRNYGVSGELIIEDTTFDANYSIYGGSIYAYGTIHLDNITVTGTGDVDAYDEAGFLYLEGDGTISNSSFTDLTTDYGGGAILHLAGDYYDDGEGHPHDFYLDISDTRFETMTADYGGTVYTAAGATTTFTNVEVLDTFANVSGGFAYLEGGGPSPDQQDDFRKLVGDSAGALDLQGTTTSVAFFQSAGLYANGLTVTDSIAEYGGVIGAAYFGNTIDLKNVVVTNAYAEAIGDMQEEMDMERGIPFSVSTGSGAVLWVEGSSVVEIEGLVVNEAEASGYGGLIYSGPMGDDYYDGPQPSAAAIPFGNCTIPIANLQDDDAEYRVGNTFRISGVTGTGLVAGLNGGIAVFSATDVVSLHASDFSDVLTAEEVDENTNPFRGLTEPSAAVAAHILTENVASFDMSCTEICGGGDSGASAYRHYDAGEFVGRGIPRRSHVRLRNNIFSYNDSAEAVVNLEVCGVDEDGPFQDLFGLSGDDSGLPLQSEGSGNTGDTSGSHPDDTDWIETGDYGELELGPRGSFRMSFNTVVGSDDSVLLGGTAGDVPVILNNNIFDGGEVALSLRDSLYIYGGYNQYNGLATIAEDDASMVFPADSAVQDAPIYWNNVAECGDAEFYLADGSPGQDAGNPNVLDWWSEENPADIGAFGGPMACFPDEDADGFIVVLDCDDTDMDIRPGANETPYDGIDQDCDGEDECDVDDDGYRSDAEACAIDNVLGDDCNDARDDINPGMPEIWYDGIDQDCMANDCDQDGDGYASDEHDCGGSDCDDTDAAIHPGAVEIDGDTIDSDCDGNNDIPEGCDVDEDGVLSDSVDCGGIDCNDNDPDIYPGAPETAGDGIDSDCVDGDDPPTCDEDGDGVLSDSVDCGGIDCDDTDPEIYPGAVDIPYDGIDQDCIDGDNCDIDHDGYIADNAECGGDDCDDTDPSVHPGATEIPDDGIDQDCEAGDAELWVQGGPDCGCSSTSTSAPFGLAWFGIMALGLMSRRRR